MSSRGMAWICGENSGALYCWQDPPSNYYSATEVAEILKRHKEIETQIEQDRDMATKTLKILLLGGPESGKSTIFKQMKILHMNGFTETDIINYRFLIYSNVIEAMHQFLEGARILKIVIDLQVQSDVDRFQSYYRNVPPIDRELTPSLGKIMERIFQGSFMKQVLLHLHEFELLDSAIYYLKNVNRLAATDYKPTIQDILRSRVQTTGIVEVEFVYKDFKIRLVDVGGQKSEQRKWIHCFDNVQGILFVADIAGYMQMLDEQNEKVVLQEQDLKNLQQDADGEQADYYTINEETRKKIYRKINRFNNTFFIESGKINKQCKLLFIQQTLNAYISSAVSAQNSSKFLIKSDIKNILRSNSFKDTSTYIKDRFLAADDSKSMPIYTHFTNATDTDNIELVFGSCMAAVLNYTMGNAALT